MLEQIVIFVASIGCGVDMGYEVDMRLRAFAVPKLLSSPLFSSSHSIVEILATVLHAFKNRNLAVVNEEILG